MNTAGFQSEQPFTPLDLSRWRSVPWIMIGVGGLGALAGAALDMRQFGFSWLLAFLFYLSLCLGALFMVLMHHLFDAAWSVPIRRIVEHIACFSFPTLPVLFLPMALLAPKIYPGTTGPLFFLTSAFCFASLGFISHRLRFWSLRQDQNGAAHCTYRMRFYSAIGIFLFAATVTLTAMVWIKALTPGWTSTMYGVWVFVASVWVTLATVYVLTVVFQRTGHLRDVLRQEPFYLLGSLFLAFTVFYAYIAYSQYFIIWNAAIPDETFWYALRERGAWKMIGMTLIFGHFFLPFLVLLRTEWKLKLAIMLPVCAWAWAMHFCDLQFQIMPALHPNGPQNLWVDLACMLFFGGVLTQVFLRSFTHYPAFPQRDPRLLEALGIQPPPTTNIATAPERAK